MLAKTNADAVHGVDARTLEVEVNSGGLGCRSLFFNYTGIDYNQRMSQIAISSKMAKNE